MANQDNRWDRGGENGPETGNGGATQADSEKATGEPSLEERLAEKDKEIAELKDKYLRAMADADNVRKRTRLQSEETVRMQRENMLRDLLPIADNLERAVEAASGGGNGKSIVEGVELVLRSLLDFLKSHGVTPLNEAGQLFDPNRHEAVARIESEHHRPNTVVEEFHRGYQIGERVLRPARVSVAAAPAGKAANGEPEQSD
jgi:molecular chaperone GrpE